jgi:hypothetical protein
MNEFLSASIRFDVRGVRGLTWDGGGQAFLEAVSESQLVASHQEAGPKEEGTPQAQERLVRNDVFCSCASLILHRLQYHTEQAGKE